MVLLIFLLAFFSQKDFYAQKHEKSQIKTKSNINLFICLNFIYILNLGCYTKRPKFLPQIILSPSTSSQNVQNSSRNLLVACRITMSVSCKHIALHSYSNTHEDAALSTLVHGIVSTALLGLVLYILVPSRRGSCFGNRLFQSLQE